MKFPDSIPLLTQIGSLLYNRSKKWIILIAIIKKKARNIENNERQKNMHINARNTLVIVTLESIADRLPIEQIYSSCKSIYMQKIFQKLMTNMNVNFHPRI